MDEQKDVSMPRTESASETDTQHLNPTQNTVSEIPANTQKNPRFSKKYILAGLFVVLAFALGVFGTLLITKNSQKNDQKNTDSQSNSSTINSNTSDKTPTTAVKDSVTWLETPKKLAVQPVFTDKWFAESYQDGSKIEDVEMFYQVGAVGNEQLIVATVGEGMGSQTMLIKKTATGYVIYQQHSPDAFFANTEGGEIVYQGPAVNPNVTIDKTSEIKEIVAPNSQKISGQNYNLSKYGVWGVDFVATQSPSSYGATYSLVASIPEGKVYEVTSKDDSSYKITYYTVMTKDHRMHPYIIDGAAYKADVTPITWTNGTKNTDTYASAVGGCGFTGSIEVAKNVSEASLEISGKTSDGQTVYILKDTNDPLFTKHYAEYKEAVKYFSDGLAADEKNMTAAQFKQKNGIFIVKDNSGRWIVMAKQKYFPQGGCAKPVVYLYPSSTTFVNVSVGADITKSDPIYPTGGWKAVLAQASGKLTYKGQAYDSLFWEGYGKGAYPAITSGSFVSRTSVEQKIKTDLAAQGLNQQEINDFWSFWSSKVPNKNYVRITWLSKQQLHALAPLYVSPKPDTTIRVFLDMEGVDSPYPLATQTFVTPKRTGFTVVEWGGLARDGTVPRLQ